MFGTDGVRGTPGAPPLDERTIVRLGAATVHSLGARPTLLVARDTRESGPWIESCLAAGVTGAGGILVSAGVIPTPAAAFVAKSSGFDGAFVISASHNPFPDNGIKVLTREGEKASPEYEARLAERIEDPLWEVDPGEPSCPYQALTDAYEAHAASVVGDARSLRGSRIAVDCANGATSVIAPRVLQAAGLDVVPLNSAPDGRNINEKCGSTHLDSVQRVVQEQQCRLGIAFDGDGDRALLVDAAGHIVDGDSVLFVCAKYLASVGQLPGDAIVATVMSNIGLEVALRAAGIAVHRCPVGDRQVREEMRLRELVLGGEQSGHIIFSRLLPTGDGLLTALSILRVMHETGKELADLTAGLEIYPQVLLNVRVRAKPNLDEEPELAAAVASAEATLGSDGRVLVRYSGTEPLLRVMIEGPDAALVNRLAEGIAEQASARLG